VICSFTFCWIVTGFQLLRSVCCFRWFVRCCRTICSLLFHFVVGSCHRCSLVAVYGLVALLVRSGSSLVWLLFVRFVVDVLLLVVLLFRSGCCCHVCTCVGYSLFLVRSAYTVPWFVSRSALFVYVFLVVLPFCCCLPGCCCCSCCCVRSFYWIGSLFLVGLFVLDWLFCSVCSLFVCLLVHCS